MHLMVIENNKKIVPKHINGSLNPPSVYKKDPITGEIVSPIPQDISIKPITAAWFSE
jgi:hypothetical protein